jgi:amidohydrolase
MDTSAEPRVKLKEALRRQAGDLAPELEALARRLHDHPELSGAEIASSRLLAERLQAAGFQVTTGQAGLPTAFVASRRAGPGPVIAYLAEYDALPEIGHGCGHNLIGAAALGAGLLLAGVVDSLGGEVRVVGTPAEETLGGKVLLTEAGVFADVDAALMVHPGVEERVLVDSLACQSLEVTYHGRGAHAVAHPEKGINALDALLALFAARDGLVRSSRPGLRIVGVITEGGVRPNMVPERAVGRFSLRAPRRVVLAEGVEAFRRMAAAVGDAHRCRTALRDTDRAYDEMRTNAVLCLVRPIR